MYMNRSLGDHTADLLRVVNNNGLSGSGEGNLGQASSDSGGWLSDIFSSIGAALPVIATTGIQAYSAITQAQTLAQRGIYPTAYSANGTPIYTSTPAGITPSNPYSLPSGYYLTPGVTPTTYSTPGVTPTTYSTPLLASMGVSQSMALPLLLGGGALLAILLLWRK
jgi:hypothetical protein